MSGVPWKIAVPVGVVLAVVAAVATWGGLEPLGSGFETPVRFRIYLPAETDRFPALGALPAISPDGTSLVFVAVRGNTRHLFLHRMDQLVTTLIPGTEAASRPFFSADGLWIGFITSNNLKKVLVAGGEPFTLCEDCVDTADDGDWSPLGDSIIIEIRGVLWEVPAGGGDPVLLVEPDPEKGEIGYDRPDVLPGGKAVLIDVRHPEGSTRSIAVLDLEALTVQTVIDDGSDPHYSPTGHIIYRRGTSYFALRFDVDRLEVTGEPVRVFEGVRGGNSVAGDFAFSENGVLAYMPPEVQSEGRTLVWVDREGNPTPITDERHPYQYPRLSPNGKRVAVTFDNQIWVYETETRTMQNLTSDEVSKLESVWVPDGSRVIYAATGAENADVFSIASDYSSDPKLILDHETAVSVDSVAPDGQIVIHDRLASGRSIMLVPPEGGTLEDLVRTEFNERGGIVSPNGRWFAYVSNRSGTDEVYVEPFPEGGPRQRISDNIGREPVWSREGTELFYRSDEQMIAVPVTTTEPVFSFGERAVLFQADRYRGGSIAGYDVDDGGQRFLMIDTLAADGEQIAPQIIVVLNWFEELKQRVPTGR